MSSVGGWCQGSSVLQDELGGTLAQAHGDAAAELGAGKRVYGKPQSEGVDQGQDPPRGPDWSSRSWGCRQGFSTGPRGYPRDGARGRAGDRPIYNIPQAKTGCPALS